MPLGGLINSGLTKRDGARPFNARLHRRESLGQLAPGDLPDDQGFKNADAPRVLCKISGSMVRHCLPQAYAKRGARPNELPALELLAGLKNTGAPRAL